MSTRRQNLYAALGVLGCLAALGLITVLAAAAGAGSFTP